MPSDRDIFTYEAWAADHLKGMPKLTCTFLPDLISIFSNVWSAKLNNSETGHGERKCNPCLQTVVRYSLHLTQQLPYIIHAVLSIVLCTSEYPVHDSHFLALCSCKAAMCDLKNTALQTLLTRVKMMCYLVTAVTNKCT